MDKDIKKELKNKLKPSRYDHTMRVVSTALEMARVFNVPLDKVEAAALFHDLGKAYDIELFKDKLEIDVYTEWSANLVHGHIGAFLAKEEYGILDEDILNAIRFHTTAREGMSILEKIICLADFIEPGRDFEGVKEIRQIAMKDINRAMLMTLDNSICFVLNKGDYLHPFTLFARNEIAKELLK